MGNPYPALWQDSLGVIGRLDGEITFTDPANQPGGGGGGTVDSVTAGDASITIGGTVVDPTVAVSALGITTGKLAAQAVTQAKLGLASVDAAQMASAGPIAANWVPLADGSGGVAWGASPGVNSLTAADASIVVGGSASAPTVRTGTLDTIATQHPPTAAVALNSQKITGLADGTVSSDAAAFGQIPTALPPNGSAGGDLSGTYPNPTVAAVQGVAVSGTAPSANQVLTASDATHAAWATPTTGGLTLLFDSTLSSAASTIDTGAGGIASGYKDLLVYIYGRTDESGQNQSTVNIFVNNDTTTVYYLSRIRNVNTTVSGAAATARSGFFVTLPAALDAASAFGSAQICFPNYALGTGYLSGTGIGTSLDTAAATMILDTLGLMYASSTAVSRLAVTPNTGGTNLVAGSRLTIYGTP